MKRKRMSGGALALVTVLLALGPPASLASGASGEVTAVRAAWKQMFLTQYFGPPARLCGMLTSGDQRWFAHTQLAPTCLAAARSLAHIDRTCPSEGGITPAHWRSAADFYLRRVHVHLLSATSAKTFDTALYETETLVKQHGRWLFSHGLFVTQC